MPKKLFFLYHPTDLLNFPVVEWNKEENICLWGKIGILNEKNCEISVSMVLHKVEVCTNGRERTFRNGEKK